LLRFARNDVAVFILLEALNPQKYRYAEAFAGLAEDNTHIVAIVLFRFSEGEGAKPVPNNYIVTAYQKEIR